MKNLRLLYTTLLIGSIIIGCKPPPPVHYNLEPALKTDFNFKAGSYWIYKDSISGEIDSFAETSYSDSSVITQESSYYEPEEYTEYIDIVISQYAVSPVPSTTAQDWKYTYEGNSVGLKYTNNNQTVQYGLFSYLSSNNFLVGSNAGNGGDTAAVNNTFVSYTLNGQTFQHVGVISHHEYMAYVYVPPYGFNDLFYMSPGIGIIKMSLNHHPEDTVNRVWEIQRWTIVK